MTSEPHTPLLMPAAATAQPLSTAAAYCRTVPPTQASKQLFSHKNNDDDEQELCSSPTLLGPAADPFLRRAWRCFRVRLAQLAYRRHLLETINTMTTTSTCLTSPYSDHGSSNHHHRSCFGSTFSSGSKSECNRVRQTYACSHERASILELLRLAKKSNYFSVQCFFAHCLQVWGHRSSSAPPPILSSLSFSSSSSSPPPLILSIKLQSDHCPAVLDRVAQAWFLRRWLTRWRSRCQRHHLIDMALRFHHKNLAHLALSTLFVNRRRKQYMQLEGARADAFHVRRLVAWWEPSAKERRKQQHQQKQQQRQKQQQQEQQRDFSVFLPDVDIMLHSNSSDGTSSWLSSPFSLSSMPGMRIDMGICVEGTLSVPSFSAPRGSKGVENEDHPHPDESSFFLPPLPEIRLLQHRVLAALGTNLNRHMHCTIAENLFTNHQHHRYLRRWTRRRRTHASIQRANFIATRAHKLHTCRRALPLLLLRTNAQRLQSTCIYTANLVWARRRATTALWRLSLCARQHNVHQRAIEIMLQSQRLHAVTRAMSLLYASARKVLLHLRVFTIVHRKESCRRALRRWQRRAAAAAVGRVRQQKAVILHKSTSLQRALLQRWSPRVAFQQKKGRHLLSLASSHCLRRRLHVSLQKLQRFTRRAALLAHVAGLGLHARMRRVICAWASVVRQEGELRAMGLALACRKELLLLQKVFGVIRDLAQEQVRLRRAYNHVIRQRGERIGREVLVTWWWRARVQEYEGERFVAFVHACLTSWMLRSQMGNGQRWACKEGAEHHDRRAKRRALIWWREGRRKSGKRRGICTDGPEEEDAQT